MASCVGPAVTRTCLPARSCSVSAFSMPQRSVGVSGSLPRPLSPQARWPASGSMMWKPRFLSAARFSCVTGLSYMPVFIAGATTTGALVASSVVVTMSSAMPCAALAMTLAVAGAITNTSAAFASEMCSTSHGKLRSNVSTTVRLPDSVSNVIGAINWVADSVISTWTVAPFWCSLLVRSAAL